MFLRLLVFLLCWGSLEASHYSIVFVHIGKVLPSYAKSAFSQARVFNPGCDLILVANEAALATLDFDQEALQLTSIACESLTKTEEHLRFLESSKWEIDFWKVTSERFLYLNDLIQQYGLKNVFHLEYDNMLYVNLEELLSVFEANYRGIAATFDNDDRCIPGFVYCARPVAMGRLAAFFADHISYNWFDMEMLALFKKLNGPSCIDNLPIIGKEYVSEVPLISLEKDIPYDKWQYCKNLEAFNSIFDAAAIGQYLGGMDPNVAASSPGFINERSLFDPSLLSFEWRKSGEGRKIPYVVYGGVGYRINNLHIHCKDLELFSSF